MGVKAGESGEGHNHIPKDYLDNAEPADVTGDADLRAKLNVKMSVFTK